MRRGNVVVLCQETATNNGNSIGEGMWVEAYRLVAVNTMGLDQPCSRNDQVCMSVLPSAYIFSIIHKRKESLSK